MKIKKNYIKKLAPFSYFNIKIHVIFLKKKSDPYLLRNMRKTDWAWDGRTARPLI